MNREEEIEIIQADLLIQIKNMFERRFSNKNLIEKILEKADELKEYNAELKK